MLPNSLEKYIRDVHDFPKKGIVFKDITPMLQSAEAMQEACSLLMEALPSSDIQKVVGIESRGFIFGPLLARELSAGFVPVRKPGKLPAKKLSESYALEYGTDILEIHEDAIQKGDHVLIHDDLLATGGTAEASCKLVERLGGKIIQISFLIELSFLKGRERLTEYEVSALLSY
jgi:adenine phosphoribosyltransferase